MADTGAEIAASDFLAAYRASAGPSDELLDANGEIRPLWRPLIAAFTGYGPDTLRQRVQRAQQYLRDAGVFFRAYGPDGSVERDWPLSHVPVLMSDADWRQIEAGLRQRADLLEAVVADLYGPGRLVADGHLPAGLVARMPEWLRPMVGVTPASRHWLHFIAFEVGRGPDGRWWVLGDRTQAPSGAGFAIENRIAMSRMLPEFFGDGRIARLGGFFQDFRDAIEGLAGGGSGRAAVLTPGLLNDGYYEHAYIARHLGFVLLEGEDLVVQGSQVLVRTVEGLQPVSVLWRRLDANFADPLELNEGSRLGTPGLVGALRRHGLNMVNALGSGVLETRAMLAFLPRICEALTGQSLIMPNIATWWCGQPAERAHVQAHTERMMIGSALATRLPFDTDEATVLGSAFRDEARASVHEWIDREADLLVGQETVHLSTTPILDGGRLVPRPVSLRVFAARTAGGWRFMPGGYARIGRSEDLTAISLQRGGSVADLWVTGQTAAPGSRVTELQGQILARNEVRGLPSRAADNLYWLGRYVERAEGTMRLLRAYHLRLSEAADPSTPLLGALADWLAARGVNVAEPMPEGLLDTLAAGVRSAAQVRDRFSLDGWVALTELQASALSVQQMPETEDDIARSIGQLLRQVTGFSGLVQDNMYRFTGWRFLSFGRALERAIGTCAVVAAFADREAPLGGLDLAIEFADSGMTHRRRYTVTTNRATVIDLLVLDRRNPRSVVYQLDRLRDLAAALPGAETHGAPSDFMRGVIRAQTDIALARTRTLNRDALERSIAALARVSDMLTETYLR